MSELDVMDSANLRRAKSSAARTLRQRLNGKHSMSLPEIGFMWAGEYGLRDDDRAELLRYLTERNGTKR